MNTPTVKELEEIYNEIDKKRGKIDKMILFIDEKTGKFTKDSQDFINYLLRKIKKEKDKK